VPSGRFTLDPSYRRPDDGTVVVAGSPLRVFRLSAGGARVMRAIERGQRLPAGHQPLTDRLLDAGAVHPAPDPADSAFTAADVTVVVPALGEVPRLAFAGPVVVVDDASEPPLQTDGDRRLVRHEVRRGPGAARNTGLAEVHTPLVAFVDADVQIDDPHWLEPLLAHFADPAVVLVAPRITSRAVGDSLLAQYESARSPLDLGAEPARVQAGTRVSYVPAAVLLCRTDAVRAAGGFDPELRFGEDVDLVWRLAEAGGRCRYEPAVCVAHRPRASWRAWFHQRRCYGSSAAPLAARHPGALAPLRISGWSAAVWMLVALRRPLAALAVAAGTSAALTRKLPDLPPSEAARLAALGHLHAGRQIASAITRVWWPILLPLMVMSRRARRVVAAAACIPPLADWVAQRPRIDPARYVALRIADDAAYATGVWQGVLREGERGPLVPSLTNWPPRGGR
jgi:mycofactocin system glycosyltransferase